MNTDKKIIMKIKGLIEKYEAIIETLEDIQSAQKQRAIVESSRKAVQGMFTDLASQYTIQIASIDKELAELKLKYEKQISNE